MNVRITFDDETQRRAEAKAADMGVSLEEYVRRLVAGDLGEPELPTPQPRAHISEIFDLITDGPPTDIAQDKDKMVAEAVWKNHLRKMGSEVYPASDKSR